MRVAFRFCFVLLLALLNAPGAQAQTCAGGVCVVGFEGLDQTTTFEARNLRPDAVVVSLWMETFSGMTASAPLPLTFTLGPVERREVLTVRRADAGVAGRYRYAFDWRFDPPTACTSPLACAWWERTPERATYYAVRKLDIPITVSMVGARGDTTTVTLTSDAPVEVTRQAPHAPRPAYRLSARPGLAGERYDSTRVYPLPYRGTLRVVQTPEEAEAQRVSLSLPPLPPNSTPAIVWEASPGHAVYAVREGVVVAIEEPGAEAPADTLRSEGRMVVTRRERSGATVIVVHTDGTTAQYTGLQETAIAPRVGTLLRLGDVVGAVDERGRLGLCLQHRERQRTVSIPARFRTTEGTVRPASGMRLTPAE